jgi:hypothetical protein
MKLLARQQRKILVIWEYETRESEVLVKHLSRFLGRHRKGPR